MSLNLKLDSLIDSIRNPRKRTSAFWITLSGMQNTRIAVDVAAKRVLGVVVRDKKFRAAVKNLKMAKRHLVQYGASESIMAVFNEDGGLGRAINMRIPTITAANARSVGLHCCESIDAAVEDAYALVKKFFDDLSSTVAAFFDKLDESAGCQYDTINMLISDVLCDIEAIDAEEYAQEEVTGYTQPVYDERVAALNYLANNLSSVEADNDSMSALAPYLKTLGYNVVETESSAEELTTEEGEPVAEEIIEEPELEIVEETEQEAAADAPAPSEVMSPEPVIEEVESDDTPSTENDEGDGGEPVEVVEFTPPESEGPADSCQTQTTIVFRWTPAAVKSSAEGLSSMLGNCSKLKGVSTKLAELRSRVDTAIEVMAELSPESKTEKEAEIECARRYAAFVGDALIIFDKSVGELVDQMVVLCAKLKNAEVEETAPEAVDVEEITVEEPLGDKRRSVKKKVKKSKGTKKTGRRLFMNEGGEHVDPTDNPAMYAPIVPGDPTGPEDPIVEPITQPAEGDQTELPHEDGGYEPEYVEEPAGEPVADPIVEPIVQAEPISARRGRRRKMRNLWDTDEEVAEPDGVSSDFEVPETPEGVDPEGYAQPEGVTEPHREAGASIDDPVVEENLEKDLEEDQNNGLTARRRSFWA